MPRCRDERSIPSIRTYREVAVRGASGYSAIAPPYMLHLAPGPWRCCLVGLVGPGGVAGDAGGAGVGTSCLSRAGASWHAWLGLLCPPFKHEIDTRNGSSALNMIKRLCSFCLCCAASTAFPRIIIPERQTYGDKVRPTRSSPEAKLGLVRRYSSVERPGDWSACGVGVVRKRLPARKTLLILCVAS